MGEWHPSGNPIGSFWGLGPWTGPTTGLCLYLCRRLIETITEFITSFHGHFSTNWFCRCLDPWMGHGYHGQRGFGPGRTHVQLFVPYGHASLLGPWPFCGGFYGLGRGG